MSTQNTNVKLRCPSCKHWSAGTPYHCPECGAIMNMDLERERIKALEAERVRTAERQAEEALPPLRRGLRKIGRTFETIYLAIVSFIAWLLFWLAG